MVENREIQQLLSSLQNRASFEEFYGEIREIFRSRERLHELHAESCKSLEWPEGIGVYVIKSSSSEDIIYVGMTGKIKRTATGEVALEDNRNGFKSRRSRWHPYCFSESGDYIDHFEYGPNFSVNDLKKQPAKDRYKVHIPIKDLSIDCLVLGNASTLSPTFLEGLILQSYYTHKETLPVGNNIL